MTVPRSLVILALAVALGTWLAPLATAPAGAADAVTAVQAAPVTGAGPGQAAESPDGGKGHGLIDASSVFFGCAVGTTVGALVTALPPLVGWTFYAGALPAVVALIATSGIGCTVGLFGGVILSTFHWVAATVGEAWSAVFG